jgi:hypothetical protein
MRLARTSNDDPRPFVVRQADVRGMARAYENLYAS